MRHSLLLFSFIGLCTCISYGAWVNATSNLAGMKSECGTLGLISSVPGKDKVIAGIAARGLWATTNGGASWYELGTGAGSASIPNRPSVIIYDPANSDIFWECGIYNGAGVFKTIDGGTTFTRLGNISHNDGLSIDLSDPERKTMIAGGHEQYLTLYKSADGGSTWANIGPNLPAGTAFSGMVHLVNAQTYLVACVGWGGGTTGIFRSTDGGTSWASATGLSVEAEPLETKDGTIYWPLQYDNGLLKSTDKGQTWTQATPRLIIKSCHPLEMPDGSLATLSRGRQVMCSVDGGLHWTNRGPQIPNVPNGITYNEVRKAFFVNFNGCDTTVLPFAVLRLDDSSYSAVSYQPKAPVPAVRHSAIVKTFGGMVRTSAAGMVEVYDLYGRLKDRNCITGNDRKYQIKKSGGISLVRINARSAY